MGTMSGIVLVGGSAVPVCPVPAAGVLVKNAGAADGPVIWLGGPDVAAGDGYPLEPGGPGEQITGPIRAKQSPVVPAPPQDSDPMMLYGCTDPDAGESRAAWMFMGGA
jgi:hypothetical protein